MRERWESCHIVAFYGVIVVRRDATVAMTVVEPIDAVVGVVTRCVGGWQIAMAINRLSVTMEDGVR